LLQAITKLACGSNNCNRRSGVHPELVEGLHQDLITKTLSMAAQMDAVGQQAVDTYPPLSLALDIPGLIHILHQRIYLSELSIGVGCYKIRLSEIKVFWFLIAGR
jgi:hypothetical protein